MASPHKTTKGYRELRESYRDENGKVKTRYLGYIGKDPTEYLTNKQKGGDIINFLKTRPDLAQIKGGTIALVENERRRQPKVKPTTPIIEQASYEDWLPKQDACNLLLTDPPFSTDVDNIEQFSQSWLPLALSKVKDTGRAYIFIGAYPKELNVYLSIQPPEHLILANVLVWTYRNTIGPAVSHDYKQNWQAILYYRGINSPPLNCPLLIEQFTVQPFNAPDARFGERFHAWEKPMPLAERLISQSTKAGDLILDCFAGTGTFVLAGAKLGRVAHGCDLSKKMLNIAKSRGCVIG